MTSELKLEGLDVAPGVVETIVMLAAQGVEGVECVEAPGLAGLVQKAGRQHPVEVSLAEDGSFAVKIHLSATYGRPLRAIASDVQSAIADALLSQTGQRASSVDVFVDAIAFPS